LSHRSPSAAEPQPNADFRHQTSDSKANHRGHGELRPEGTEMMEIMAKTMRRMNKHK
jgi:hypothetical protein